MKSKYKTHDQILNENGWTVQCESPYEVRHKGSESFATNQAVFSIVHEVRLSELFNKLHIIKDAYEMGIINDAKYMEETIKLLNDEHENETED